MVGGGTKHEAKKMYDVRSLGISAIAWYRVVKAANVPLAFVSTINVEIAVTKGSGTVPHGIKLEPVE